MKKILTAMVAVAAFTFSAAAQETGKEKLNQHGKHGQHHRFKNGIGADLNLTAEQKEQMKAIRETTKQQLADLRKNDNISVKEYREKMSAIRKEQKEKMTSIFTPEQKEKIAKSREAQKEKMQAMRTERLEQMKTKLNLSDEQVAKIKATNEAQKEKAKAIRENGQLSQSEKKQQLMTLKGENKEAFKKILTEEQIQKFEEMRKQRTHRSK